MITYIRNCILVLAAQAFIIKFCLNLALVPRLEIAPFTFGEIFVLCTAFMVLTHNIRLTFLLESVNTIRTIAANIATMQFNIANLTLKRMDVMQNTLNEASMKLKDVKPLDKPTMTVEQIAKKHGVSVDSIERQLEMGVKVEREHTSDDNTAKEIALDHLMELPDYYTKLKKVENED